MTHSHDPIPDSLMQKTRVMSECDEVREIPTFPLYIVTLNGQVWSVRTRGGSLTLPRIPKRMKSGKQNTFWLINENQNGIRVSIARLLLLAFVSPPPFEEANAAYLDGNLTNISLDNLVWLSAEERASRHLQRAGNPLPENGSSKLSTNDIKQMRSEYLAGATLTELADKYQMHKTSVRQAVRGISWDKAGEGIPTTIKNIAIGSKASHSKLTENQVREIKRRLANGDLQKDIAKDYGVAAPSINAIALGRAWSHIK